MPSQPKLATNLEMTPIIYTFYTATIGRNLSYITPVSGKRIIETTSGSSLLI